MILALADAYVEAFTLYGVPADRQAEKDLQTAAQQMAATSISGIRGHLQLRSIRLRIAEDGTGCPGISILSEPCMQTRKKVCSG
jgi:hypothetical protein